MQFNREVDARGLSCPLPILKAKKALAEMITGEVLRVIERLAEEGMTMVMVTHEMNFARKIADQIVFMHQGKVWEIGPASVLDNPQTPELRDFLAHEL